MSAITAARPSWVTYGLIILATAIVAWLGAGMSNGSDDAWYGALNKSPLNPPYMTFAIVWPILFVLMAAGAIMVRSAAGSFQAAAPALGLFFAQFIPNLGWSYAFFGFNEALLALFILLALWVMIASKIAAYWRWSRRAAWLQAPYLIWVTFAGYLNAFIVGAN